MWGKIGSVLTFQFSDSLLQHIDSVINYRDI